MNVKPVFEAEEALSIAIAPTDMATELRRSNPARLVFQPAAEWVEVPFGRQLFQFPPDLPGAPLVAHPALRENGKPIMVPANGTLEIADNFGPELDTKTRVFRRGMRPVQGESADDFLKHIDQTDKLRKAGFTWLRNDGRDDQRKKLARKTYGLSRRQWAEQELQTRAEAIANFKKLPQNQGQPVPPPTSLQQEAQEYMDEMRSEASAGVAFRCEHGCFASDDFAKYQRHMKVNHQEEVTAQLDGEDITPAPKNKGGRPRKAEAAA